MSWQPIPLDTPLTDLVDKHIAVSGTSIVNAPTSALISIKRSRKKKGRVRLLCLERALRSVAPPAIKYKDLPGSVTLREVMLSYVPITPLKAAEVPYIHWGSYCPKDWESPEEYSAENPKTAAFLSRLNRIATQIKRALYTWKKKLFTSLSNTKISDIFFNTFRTTCTSWTSATFPPRKKSEGIIFSN